MVQVWTNISAYRFVDMPDYEEMRIPLRQFCNRLGIKGTILLSHEGINIFLSAPQDKIDAFFEQFASNKPKYRNHFRDLLKQLIQFAIMAHLI